MRLLLPVSFDMPLPLELAQKADLTSYDADDLNLEQLPLDDSLGAVLIGTFVGLMYVYHIPMIR